MAHYLPLIILIAIISAASIILDRKWQARQTATTDDTESADSEATPAKLTARMTDGIKESWDKLRGRSSTELTQQFKTWVDQELKGEKGLKDWVASLSDEGIESLTKQLATFCSDLNLDLAWLVNGDLEVDPDLKKNAQAIVVAYCSACWQAAQAQNDLHAFTIFRTFEQDPSNKKHRQFGQKLYAKLAEENEVSLPPLSELLSATEKEQLERTAQAIQAVAEKDRPALNKAIKAVLAEEGDSEESPEPAQEATTSAPTPKAKAAKAKQAATA